MLPHSKGASKSTKSAATTQNVPTKTVKHFALDLGMPRNVAFYRRQNQGLTFFASSFPLNGIVSRQKKNKQHYKAIIDKRAAKPLR